MRLFRIVVMLSLCALACNNEAYAQKAKVAGGLFKIFKPKPPKSIPKPKKGDSIWDRRPPRLPRGRGNETCPNCGGSGIIFLDPYSPMPCIRCGGAGHVPRS